MSKRFKPGDLALIVRSHHGRNLGRTVELLECLGRPDRHTYMGVNFHNRNSDIIWIVRALGDPLQVSEKCQAAGMPARIQEGPQPEAFLMPLGGAPESLHSLLEEIPHVQG